MQAPRERAEGSRLSAILIVLGFVVLAAGQFQLLREVRKLQKQRPAAAAEGQSAQTEEISQQISQDRAAMTHHQAGPGAGARLSPQNHQGIPAQTAQTSGPASNMTPMTPLEQRVSEL